MASKLIKILGAGISGLSAAITLARNGLRVEVFEKSSHAGGRFNRDFQCLRNFGDMTVNPIAEFEKLGITLKPYKKLKRIFRYSRSHSFEVVRNNQPIYYLVLRGRSKNSIDSQLENLAVSQAVNINYHTKLNINEVDIVATGPLKADGFAYGRIYEDTNLDEAGYIFLDMRYSPSGYVYVLPGEKKGEAAVIETVRDPSIGQESVKLSFNRALQENTVLNDLLNGATMKSIERGVGCSTLLDNPYQNNRYYVGEAAGLQDATAGFGIRYAVISGYLAALSILDDKDYNQLIADEFKTLLEFERTRSENFKKLSNEDIDKIFKEINKKFGQEVTIEEYESIRGVI
ncbi:MAG: NAD(P)-binding protein [Thermoplasmatales archaeon]|nr:MAG: NAD(P)-binding protein [Thermoplasmatales archaeon]